MNKTQWKLNHIQKKLLHSANNGNDYSTHKAVKELMLSKNSTLQQIIKLVIKESKFIYSTRDLIASNKISKIPTSSPYTLFVCTGKTPRPLNTLETIGLINVIQSKLKHRQIVRRKNSIKRKKPQIVKKLSHYKLFKNFFDYYYSFSRFNFFMKVIVKIAFAIIFAVLIDLFICLILGIIRVPIDGNNIFVLFISLIIGCYLAIKDVTIDTDSHKR